MLIICCIYLLTSIQVRDYGILRPKLVYNCHFVPALCNNAKQYLGAGVLTRQFHYDRLRPKDKSLDSRNTARRAGVCGGPWIDTPRTDGRAGPNAGRCPEADQPDWYYQKFHNVVGPKKPIMYQSLPRADGTVEVSNNRLAEIRDIPDPDNPGTTKQKWYEISAVLSCDEFPAARYAKYGFQNISLEV